MNNNIKNGNVNKRNWKEINYGKTRQIMLFMDKSILDKEKNRLKILNCNKEGAKFRYSNELIEFLVMIQNYFKLDFRKLMAFCRLFNQSLKIPCPDYSTINR